MSELPVFPRFKPVELGDRGVLQKIIWDYQPETSELTFSNLFIWQSYYRFEWSLYGDWLLVVSQAPGLGLRALPPVGPAPRMGVCRLLLEWLRQEHGETHPAIERADRRLISEIQREPHFSWEPLRDHFDYVYRTEDLISLAGGKYHAKRNHINAFQHSYTYSYEVLREDHIASALDLAETWCRFKRCEEDLSLMGEWEAVAVALKNFQTLGLARGVIIIDGRVEAFTLGERLNRDTAVVHLEKANPEIRGLYAVINQHFLESTFAEVPFVNREQDLDDPGLRRAKMSYHPDHFTEKFRLRLA